MKTEFTPAYIKSHCGCYSLKKVNSIPGIRKRKIILEDIVNAKIPLKDKFWFIGKYCNFNYKERSKCLEFSEKIKNIFSSGGLMAVHFWRYDLRYSSGFLNTKEKHTVLKEILRFSKTLKS